MYDVVTVTTIYICHCIINSDPHNLVTIFGYPVGKGINMYIWANLLSVYTSCFCTLIT